MPRRFRLMLIVHLLLSFLEFPFIFEGKNLNEGGSVVTCNSIYTVYSGRGSYFEVGGLNFEI